MIAAILDYKGSNSQSKLLREYEQTVIGLEGISGAADTLVVSKHDVNVRIEWFRLKVVPSFCHHVVHLYSIELVESYPSMNMWKGGISGVTHPILV